jgi:hypothetical protein
MNRVLKLAALGFTLVFVSQDLLLASGGELQFSSSIYTVSYNTPVARIEVDLLNSTGGAVAVNFATQDLMGAAGISYLPTNGTLVFVTGETEKFFSVPVLNDPPEGPVTVLLTLSDPIATPSAELMIVPVPEPSELPLTGLGIAALATVVRRRKA